MKKRMKFAFIGLAVVIAASILMNRKTIFLKCPEPMIVEGFDPKIYSGRWYELAYKDVAQFSICKCFKFDFTLKEKSTYNFDYTASCPGRNGYADYPVHSTVDLDEKMPNVLHEYVAGLTFFNNIVKIYKKGETYDRAIQFQCKEFLGVNVYIGFNLVTRNPQFKQEELDEMIQDIEKLGLARYGGNREGLTPVKMEACTLL